MSASERNKRYRLRHPDKLKEYYIKNKARIIAKVTAWRKKNPEKMMASLKKSEAKYRKTPKAFWHNLKQNSGRGGRELLISQKDFLSWYERQPKKCHYCGLLAGDIPGLMLAFPYRKFLSTRLTIDRVNNDIGYREDNMVLACEVCNSTKSNVFDEETMLEIAKIIKRKWRKYVS